MRLRHFTHRHPIPATQIKLPEWKTDPKVIIKHDGLYARTWESENENSNFDSDYNNLVEPISPEITVPSEGAADEMSPTSGTIRERSPEIYPQE